MTVTNPALRSILAWSLTFALIGSVFPAQTVNAQDKFADLKWQEFRMNSGSFVFQAPLNLTPREYPLPATARENVVESEMLFGELPGVAIVVGRVRSKEEGEISLDGAAQGALRELMAMSGCVLEEYHQKHMSFHRRDAVESVTKFDLKGHKVQHVSTFIVNENNLYSVVIACEQDDSRFAEKVWRTMLSRPQFLDKGTVSLKVN